MTFVASPRIRSVGCIYADRCVYAPDAAYTHMCLYAVVGAYTRVGAFTQAAGAYTRVGAYTRTVGVYTQGVCIRTPSRIHRFLRIRTPPDCVYAGRRPNALRCVVGLALGGRVPASARIRRVRAEGSRRGWRDRERRESWDDACGTGKKRAGPDGPFVACVGSRTAAQGSAGRPGTVPAAGAAGRSHRRGWLAPARAARLVGGHH